MRRALLFMLLVLSVAFFVSSAAIPAHADPTLYVSSGFVENNLGNDIFSDLVTSQNGTGFTFGTSTTRFVGNDLPTGHSSMGWGADPLVGEIWGTSFFTSDYQVQENFIFDPLQVPSLLVAAPLQSVSSSFTMTGTIEIPSTSISADLAGQGILTASSFLSDPSDPESSKYLIIDFAFVPEPSVLILLAVGVLAICVMRSL